MFARETSAGQRDTEVSSSGSKRSALIAESTLTEPGDISSSHCVAASSEGLLTTAVTLGWIVGESSAHFRRNIA